MRRFTRIRLNVIVVTAATLVFAGSAQAVSCEELRSSVEAKILGKGVKNFSVTVVEAGTAWPGQVVVYRQAEAAPVAVPALMFQPVPFRQPTACKCQSLRRLS